MSDVLPGNQDTIRSSGVFGSYLSKEGNAAPQSLFRNLRSNVNVDGTQRCHCTPRDYKYIVHQSGCKIVRLRLSTTKVSTTTYQVHITPQERISPTNRRHMGPPWISQI